MILKTEVLSMQRYKIKSINNQKHNKITPQRSNFYLPWCMVLFVPMKKIVCFI